MQLVAINSLLMFDVVFIFFLFLVGVSCLVYYLPQQPRLSPAETDETSYVILSAPTRAKHHAQAPVEEV